MPTLVAASGPQVGARFEIGSELIVGRSPSCRISLPDDGKVSRRHARFWRRDEQWAVADLGSRNGTFLNGEPIDGEVALSPGDRIQVGDTLLLFAPPVRAAIDDAGGPALGQSGAVEEFLPASGETAMLFRAASGFIGCASEAAALRRGAEEAMRALAADVAASLLPGETGLFSAAVVGADDVSVARPLLRAALERREAAIHERAAAAPIWSGGAAFGLLYVQREEGTISARELGTLGVLGRLCGEAVAAIRSRQPPQQEAMLVGTSRVFRRCLEQLRRAAAGNAPITLLGEPGTGKALLSYFLHARSPRAGAPFVRVDCRAANAEQELFGRPAAPGSPPRLSAMARADGGTLALAGVEALPRALAERLARALRNKVAPLPDGGEGSCDVRVVVCTAEPLAKRAALGELDVELAKVLEGEELQVPPLRERGTDISLLFEHFAGRTARHAGRAPLSLSTDARAALHEYAWPGNVRELRLVAERVALHHAGQQIEPGHLPPEVRGGASSSVDDTLADAVAKLERELVSNALRRARGKKIRAAELLGISRPTLDKKIELYKLAVK